MIARLLDVWIALSLFALRVLFGASQHHHRTADGVVVRSLRVRRPGKPVAVLIHGFSDRPETFLRTARHLRDYDVIIPGLPGFHESLVEGVHYDVRSFARWVASALDALDVRDAHVCGNSLGGATALVLSAERPDLVRTLVPLDAGGIDAPGVPSIHDEVRAGHNLFEVRRADQVPGFLARIFHRPPPSFAPMRQLVAIHLAERADTYARIMSDLAREGLENEAQGSIVPLEAIAHPTLVAWGDSDSLFPLGVGEYLADRIEGARLHVFPETGHCPHLERPADLARACSAFWAEQDGGPSGVGAVR